MAVFPCTRCGACCRSIGGAAEAGYTELDGFALPDGSCRYLTVDGDGLHGCAIYETRPRICRVDQLCPPVMQEAEWYRRNEEACDVLHLRVYGSERGRL